MNLYLLFLEHLGYAYQSAYGLLLYHSLKLVAFYAYFNIQFGFEKPGYLIGFLFGAGIAMGVLGFLWILIIIIIVAMAFTAIALLIGSRIKTIEVYTIISQTIVMPAWFLSGAFFPASSFPGFLRPFSYGDPLTYATSGIRDVMLNGYFPIGNIFVDFSIIIAFTVAVTIISFKLFKSTIS